MSLEKCVVVNCSALSHVRLQGALLDEAGLAFRVEGNAAYLGAVVGPDAEHGFRAKTRVKHLTSVADIRDTAGLARSRLVTYMMFASSVLHYLAQLVLVPIGLQRAEAATVASLLVAPVWAFSPDALSSIHRTSCALPSGPCRWWQNPRYASLWRTPSSRRSGTLAVVADELDAFLVPRAPSVDSHVPLAFALEALRKATALPEVIRMHPTPQASIHHLLMEARHEDPFRVWLRCRLTHMLEYAPVPDELERCGLRRICRRLSPWHLSASWPLAGLRRVVCLVSRWDVFSPAKLLTATTFGIKHVVRGSFLWPGSVGGGRQFGVAHSTYASHVRLPLSRSEIAFPGVWQ